MNPSSYVRYLEAKQTVDERSINQQVWSEFILRLNQSHSEMPLHVMEIGAGTGSTFIKILEAVRLKCFEYTIVEMEPDHVTMLIDKLNAWTQKKGGRIIQERDGEYIVEVLGQVVKVRIDTEEIESYLGNGLREPKYDAIIGQAILDLLDLDTIFPLMANVLRKGGLYYFPISFDGSTSFLPGIRPRNRQQDRGNISC